MTKVIVSVVFTLMLAGAYFYKNGTFPLPVPDQESTPATPAPSQNDPLKGVKL